MPTIPTWSIVEGDTSSHGRITPRGASDSTSSERVWIIIASVAGVVALGSCIALVVMSLSKHRSRKASLDEARQRDPCLGKRGFSKKRRMATDIIDLEAESQRDAMIRKSIASRSGRSISLSSQFTVSTMSVEDRPETTPARGCRLDDNPANLAPCSPPRSSAGPGSGSGLGARNKSWEHGGNVSARSESPLPDMPERAFSRSASPTSRPSELPPLLELHPIFRGVSNESRSEHAHR